MERLRFRSTRLADLQAELREREHLSGADRTSRDPVRRTRRTVFGLPRGWRRQRDRDGS